MNNGEVSRKYLKKISRNGWMAKFQQWCFGDLTPNFVGYCPFFWFTWICVFISPLILVGKILEPIGRFLAWSFHSLPTSNPRPHYIRLAYFYKVFLESSLEEIKASDNAPLWEDILDWIEETPNWEDYAKAALARRQKRDERDKRKNKRNTKLRTFINKWLVPYSGFLVKPLLIVTALAFSYGFFKIIWFFITHVTLVELIYFGEVIIGCFVLAIVFNLIARGYWCLKTWLDKRPPKESVFTQIIFQIFTAIGIGIDFVFETITLTYKRECPLIEWADENEPIKRRT